MNTIGSYIKQYRTSKGITQEQLGEMVGVTTQAVSKWERGGTPDAELLPRLAEVLGVSIDALFGKEDKDLPFLLAKKLRTMSIEEAYRYAYNICWSIEIGLLDDPYEPDDFLKKYANFPSYIGDSPRIYSRIMLDQGAVLARNAKDFHYFFMMLEPESGLQAQLSNMEQLRQVFAIFANKELLKIITYLYTRLNTPIASSLISKNTGFTTEEVDAHMEILVQQNLVKRTTIDTADGIICSYMFNLESAVVAMLCFADELARKSNEEFIWYFNRTKPLFNQPTVDL